VSEQGLKFRVRLRGEARTTSLAEGGAERALGQLEEQRSTDLDSDCESTGVHHWRRE